MGRTHVPHQASSPALLAVGIVLVSINLRAGIAVVGPVVDEIRHDLGLSSAAAGLLTTLPVLGFGVASPLAVPASRRVGVDRTLACALVLLLAGTLLRVAGSAWAAYAGTALLGVAIAAGNVLLPVLVKRDFPLRVGPLTSLYVTVMVAVAGIASAVAVPLADDAGLGWQGALAVWALPVGAALVVWLPRSLRAGVPPPAERASAGRGRMRRSWLAWQVTAYMGLQSFLFYALIAWLSDLLRDDGVSAGRAGLMVGVMQVTSLLATIAVPIAAGRVRDQRGLVVAASVLGTTAMIGLLVAPGELPLLWASLVGIGGGGTLSLALAFFVWRTRGDRDAAALSGMAQSLGYLFAASGPFILGALHDATDAWTAPVVVLLVVWVLTGVAGLGAGRDRVVG
jgi:MFS transporter, CP family, cyanate transporter